MDLINKFSKTAAAGGAVIKGAFMANALWELGAGIITNIAVSSPQHYRLFPGSIALELTQMWQTIHIEGTEAGSDPLKVLPLTRSAVMKSCRESSTCTHAVRIKGDTRIL